MATIALTQGYETVVDDDDYSLVCDVRWKILKSRHHRYAVRNTPRGAVLMHRYIMDAPAHLFVDHINGNGLDNRRCNLRLATRADNVRNRRKTTGSSQFKGVYWSKAHSVWHAQISDTVGGTRFLGFYDDERHAAVAYDRAAVEAYGEFANLNGVTIDGEPLRRVPPKIRHAVRGAKLDQEAVRRIREMVAQGITGREIAQIFRVSDRMISAIKTLKAWKHVA